MTRCLTAVLLGVMLASASMAEEWTTTAGEVLSVTLPLTAMTSTYTLEDPEGRAYFLASYVVTMGSTFALKYEAGRERPDGSDNLSFPSSHTSSAFSGAAYLQRRLGWEVGLPAYLSAAFVGWSQVDAENHHVSDVLASAALAWGVNAWLVPRADLGQAAILPVEGGMKLAYEVQF